MEREEISPVQKEEPEEKPKLNDKHIQAKYGMLYYWTSKAPKYSEAKRKCMNWLWEYKYFDFLKLECNHLRTILEKA